MVPGTGGSSPFAIPRIFFLKTCRGCKAGSAAVSGLPCPWPWVRSGFLKAREKPSEFLQ